MIGSPRLKGRQDYAETQPLPGGQESQGRGAKAGSQKDSSSHAPCVCSYTEVGKVHRERADAWRRMQETKQGKGVLKEVQRMDVAETWERVQLRPT